MRKMILLLITVVILITGYNEFIKADNKPNKSDSASSTVVASEDDTDKDKDTKAVAVNKDIEKKSKQKTDKNKKSSKNTVVSNDKSSKISKGSDKQVSTTETPNTEAFNKESSYSDPPCNEAPSNESSTTESPSTESSTTETSPTEVPCPEPEEPATEAPPAPEPVSVSYSPQNVVAMATSQCIAGGMIRTTDNLDNLLANGSITQEEYNEYYPYDGLGYYSVFVETDLNKASTTSGALLGSEAGIADYISGMLLLESNPYFLIEYAGTTDCGGQSFYEFRCYR